ncbi:MAG: hypothetical protein CMJ64_29255 [Planctomycetaceae bacterium]|nr:hypothetical protein [Planctomycetaceae bacterium]
MEEQCQSSIRIFKPGDQDAVGIMQKKSLSGGGAIVDILPPVPWYRHARQAIRFDHRPRAHFVASHWNKAAQPAFSHLGGHKIDEIGVSDTGI